MRRIFFQFMLVIIVPHAAIPGWLLLLPQGAMLPLAVVGKSLDSAIQEDDADEEDDKNDRQNRQDDQQQIRLEGTRNQ